MIVRIVLWSLADSKSTIEELRRYLQDEFDVEATVEGRHAEEQLSRLGLAFE